MRTSVLSVLGVLAACSLAVGQPTGVVAVVGYRGGPVPGIPGATYSNLLSSSTFAPWMSPGGQVAFFADIAGTGIDATNNRVVVFGAGGAGGMGEVVARTGGVDPATGGTIAALDTFVAVNAPGGLPTLALSGRLAPDAGLGISVSNDTARWVLGPGGSQVALREGSAFPGLVGPTITDIGVVNRLFASGQTASLVTIAGDGVDATNNSALLVGAPGSPTVLARRGSPIEGNAVSTVLSTSVTGNSSGAFLFRTGFSSTPASGIAAGRAGELRVIAAQGQPVPGSGVTLASASSLTSGTPLQALNDAGRAALVAPVTSGAATVTTLFVGSIGDAATPPSFVRAIAQGDAAPGIGGVTLGPIRAISLDGQGRVYFVTTLTGSVTAANNNAVWSYDPDATPAVSLVLRTGAAAPGFPLGTSVTSIPTSPTLATNRRGDLAINVNVTTGAVSGVGSPGNVVYLFRRADAPATGLLPAIPLLASGQVLTLAPGVSRTLSTLTHFASNGGQQDGSFGLSEAGAVAVRATLTDFTEAVLVVSIQQATAVCCRGATCAVLPPDQCVAPAGTGVKTFDGSSCSGAASTTAGCCYADFNKTGGRDVADIFGFLTAWFSDSPFADVGGDGTGIRDVADIFAFLTLWFQGCQ